MPQLNPRSYREVLPGVWATTGAARLIRASDAPVFPLESGDYWTCEMIENLEAEDAGELTRQPGHPDNCGS